MKIDRAWIEEVNRLNRNWQNQACLKHMRKLKIPIHPYYLYSHQLMLWGLENHPEEMLHPKVVREIDDVLMGAQMLLNHRPATVASMLEGAPVTSDPYQTASNLAEIYWYNVMELVQEQEVMELDLRNLDTTTTTDS